MFSIEQMLAGICELFTGPDKLACTAIRLPSRIYRSSMLHDIPAVYCMLTVVTYMVLNLASGRYLLVKNIL